MNTKFDQLESRLQQLFEQQLAGMIPGLTAEDRVIQRLAGSLKQSLLEQRKKGPTAPNVFTLIVAPDDASKWKDPKVMAALDKIVRIALSETGFKQESQLTVTITTNNTYSKNDISILASHKIEPMEDTQGMTIESDENKNSENIPENAFLIVEGVKVYPLREAVVNIGRRLENNLVIDDPRISRNHAQLRAINGRYVLFDLNSTGGSFVNGQRTSQTVLYPGDVISLAGVALIFGQDNPPVRPDLNETSPLKDPKAGERPTATLEKKTLDIKTDRFKENKSDR
jgi:pSer/pThr/pTyr-binding forkhead associated (FHA) protein